MTISKALIRGGLIGVVLAGMFVGHATTPVRAQTNSQIRANNNAMGLFIDPPTTRYHNFGATLGDGGFGFRETAGVMEAKNDAGAWIVLLPGGVGPAPSDATYITQTANATLTAEQALDALASGIMRVDTAAGVITSLTDSAGIAANISDATGSGLLVFGTSPAFLTSWDLSGGTFVVTLNDAVDAINFDLNTLSIDALNERVGIGTAAPLVELHVGNPTSGVALRIDAVSDGGGSGDSVLQFGELGNLHFSVGRDTTDNNFKFQVGPSALGTTNDLVMTVSGMFGFGTVPLTELHLEGATTPSLYINSTTATDGASVILEDTDGAGCSEATVLNGVVSWATVACPA